jgi:DNA-binding protein YbaB
VNEEIMAQFAQIQRYAAGLQGLLAEAQAMAPGRSQGADRNGAVHVTIGPDGLPSSFRVAPDWKRKIEADTFGSAVLEACQAAIGDRLSVWTHALADDGWQDRVERLKGGAADPAPPSQAPARIPPALRNAVQRARPRPADQLAEEVLGALDNVEQFTPSSASGSGSAAGGKLTVTINTTGLTSCTADHKWVSRQTAALLMNELGAALAAARADLQTQSQRTEPATEMDRLIAESLSLLNDPSRLADS